MGLPAPRLSRILFAVVFALSCFGFTLFVWKAYGGPTPFQAHGYRFHVLFGSEASQLQPNADVRISGVNVGKVVRVQRREQGADATIEMDSRFAPVPRDMRAIIRFKTLLGETFVELSPGSRTGPQLPEGGTLPRDQVAPVQQVDVVLGSFDEPTREAFKTLLQRTAKALDGRGDELNAALGHLAPAMESFADVTEALDRQRSSLRRLVRASRQVFEATAERDRELTATVDALPGFLAQTRAAFEDIRTTAQVARPVLDELRPVIPLLRPALDETVLLAPSLERLFGELGPVFDSARHGLPALTRILEAARPAVDVLDVAGRYLVPIADYALLYRTDLIAWLAKLSSAANFDSPSGQRIARLINPFDEESFVLSGQRLPSNRHNAYTLPGEIERLATNSVRSWHCRQLDNPQTIPVIGSGAPPCIQQPPLAFRGLTQQFPHVRPSPDRAARGG